MVNRRNTVLTLALNAEDKEALAQIANEFNCLWGGNPNISELIRKLATGELKVVDPKQQNQIPSGVDIELARILASASTIMRLLYPPDAHAPGHGHDDLTEHDAFYEAFIEPKARVDQYVALCPHPIKGQAFIEVAGKTESEAMQRLYEMVESSGLRENSISSVIENAVTFAIDDPKLNGHRMMLIVSM